MGFNIIYLPIIHVLFKIYNIYIYIYIYISEKVWYENYDIDRADVMNVIKYNGKFLQLQSAEA